MICIQSLANVSPGKVLLLHKSFHFHLCESTIEKMPNGVL